MKNIFSVERELTNVIGLSSALETLPGFEPGVLRLESTVKNCGRVSDRVLEPPTKIADGDWFPWFTHLQDQAVKKRPCGELMFPFAKQHSSAILQNRT